MSKEYLLTTPISQATYAGGTRVTKKLVAGNTGTSEYKRLEKCITPAKSSKLGKIGIEMVNVSKDLIGNNFKIPLVTYYIRDPEVPEGRIGSLVGEHFKITDTKGMKKFLKIMQDVKKSNSNLAGSELLQFIRKLC